MSDSKKSIDPYTPLLALALVFGWLMFVMKPEITVDPNAPVREFPIQVDLPECSP